MRLISRTCLGGLVLAAVSSPLCAEGWQQEFTPYLWAAGMNGKAGIGDVTVDVNQSFSDILSNPHMAAMGTYRASNGPNSLTLDAIYLDLRNGGQGPMGFVNGNATLKATIVEADFGRELTDRFGLLFGVRYTEVDTTLKVSGPRQTRRAELVENWADPLIGARYTYAFSNQWSASLRGDVGGFDIKSRIAWQGIASVRWQASPHIGVVLG